MRTPTVNGLIGRGEITERHVEKCFERSLRAIDKGFLDSHPGNHRMTVLTMMRNIVATAVCYWIDWRLETRFKEKEEVHSAICRLDQLTESDVWIAPPDPLGGVNGSRRKKVKSKAVPAEVQLVFSDGEVETVRLDDQGDDE